MSQCCSGSSGRNQQCSWLVATLEGEGDTKGALRTQTLPHFALINLFNKRILAIGTEWKGTTEAAFGTIVALPIFQSSLGLLRSESRPCCQENIDGLVACVSASQVPLFTLLNVDM
jgi:hypothetical protein